MVKRARRVVFAVFSTLFVQGAVAACPDVDEEALAWLDKMSRIPHEQSYHGVVTLQRGESIEVFQVSHIVGDRQSSERLTQLTGQGAQVDRASHPLNCIHPGQQLLRIGSQMRMGQRGIAEQYRISVGTDARVAGRSAIQLHVVPRDMYRFGYRMLLDRETALLLQAETFGRGKKPLETLRFARVAFGPSAPGSGVGDTLHRAGHPHPDTISGKPVVDRPWRVSWLPGGFTATDSPDAFSGRRSYTDGLAVMSVFLEELERELHPGEGLVREGGTTSYTRGMHIDDQPVLVTVIGEVPVNTARMVADSVQWVE